jgi:hypothetical protein
VGVEELQAVQIELDGAPGVGGQKVGEVVGQLRLGEGVDLIVEVLASPADGAGVRLNDLRL